MRPKDAESVSSVDSDEVLGIKLYMPAVLSILGLQAPGVSRVCSGEDG